MTDLRMTARWTAALSAVLWAGIATLAAVLP